MEANREAITQSKEGLDVQQLALVRIADALDCMVAAINEQTSALEHIDITLEQINEKIHAPRY